VRRSVEGRLHVVVCVVQMQIGALCPTISRMTHSGVNVSPLASCPRDDSVYQAVEFSFDAVRLLT
jgi:hypothetical protein